MDWTSGLIGAGLLWLFSAVGGPGSLADAPVITHLNWIPASGPAGGRVVVRLHLFDRQGAGNIIPVLYQIREGIEEIRLPIYDDGTHGDAWAADGFFTGPMTVPRTAAPGPHWFVAYVFDREGHRSNLLVYEFTVTGFEETT